MKITGNYASRLGIRTTASGGIGVSPMTTVLYSDSQARRTLDPTAVIVRSGNNSTFMVVDFSTRSPLVDGPLTLQDAMIHVRKLG